jgi:YggT family protein
MNPILGFAEFLTFAILSIMTWSIILSAIMSWLIAFNVVNPRNSFVYQIGRFLEAFTDPILRPFRRIIPMMGGVDISPIFAILIIQGVRNYLVHPAFVKLNELIGGGGLG